MQALEIRGNSNMNANGQKEKLIFKMFYLTAVMFLSFRKH